MRMFHLSLGVSIFALACASPKDAASPDDHDHEHGDKHEHEHGDKHEHGGGEKHHKELPAGPVKDFHDVMAPVWHMEKSAERLDKACAAVPAMKEKAAAITSAAAPEGKDHAAALSASLGELETACASDKATVEAKFGVAHDAFHKVMDGSKH